MSRSGYKTKKKAKTKSHLGPKSIKMIKKFLSCNEQHDVTIKFLSDDDANIEDAEMEVEFGCFNGNCWNGISFFGPLKKLDELVDACYEEVKSIRKYPIGCHPALDL